MIISYYAIFEYDYDDDGICISFPDLPGCLSCAWSTEEALKMAKEALELYLDGMEYDKFPVRSDEKTFKLEQNQKTVLISIQI